MKEIYNVLASAMGQEERLSMIANNLANVNTVGFKQDRATVSDYEKAAAQAAGTTASEDPSKPTIAFYSGGYTDFTSGSTMPTGEKLDLMIDGEGFFEIEGPAGGETFYTRAGNFILNETGELSTQGGRRVLNGNGAPITISRASELLISTDGTMTAGEESVGRIQVVRFEDASVLEKFGEGLFRARGQAQPTVAEDGKIRQGFLEGSNVSPIEELVRMIQNQRAFEANQRTIQSVDQAVGARLSGILNG